MKALAPFALCAAFVLPLAASAQKPTPDNTGDRPAVTYDEIERGLYFAVLGGPMFLTNPPAAEGTPRPFSAGPMAQVEVGVDITENFSLGVFIMGSSIGTSAEYVGNSGGGVSGDFQTMVPGAVLRARLLGLADNQEVKRTWFYLRGGAGYAMFSPKRLLPESDILVFAGPGVEYYTRLRHFSVGLEVTGNYLVSGGTFGFAVAPNIRYAF
ncbi:adventurous gliding motility protein CglE [Pyxidicoccus fallax]|uniref:Adventurous gliding motility protein CglE n=1 Tax=Pyxidicoccus fallax TaxID=394095 RepID=A0A848LWM3_9BACT|nr:adventurous gliding motility protein CglE [Pyxidicoccus fallax]NMO22196.1 adventurous gliding motility protein CglE [Pyxidicoccus fallax]NPC83828.1 adventurous gliding motility protein CglE [Pyxidicoccus fallax]